MTFPQIHTPLEEYFSNRKPIASHVLKKKLFRDKVKEQKWRMGTAVYGFVSSPNYKTPKFLIEKSKDLAFAKYMAWSVILFELTFPLVLTLPSLTTLYLAAGVVFHLVNFITFGLNRFFWVWCASYPAIYYCSKLI